MSPVGRWSHELPDRLTRARERDSWRRETTAVALLVIVGIALGAAHIEEEVAVPVLVVVYALTWLTLLSSRRT